MGRFLVMDIVFYGGSMNYDQGTGNYQELKKITKWDGRQYTLVSRYALRYSILHTAERENLWEIANGDKLVESGDKNKQVIQPKPELLLNGEILKYPEFDLFGYLITSTVPQASKVSPVKISHAISMTPFYFDNQFAGNMGLARRRLPYAGKMDINLFTMEEHYTYYLYSIVVDLDNIGKNEIYLSAKSDKWQISKFEEHSEHYVVELKGDKAKKAGLEGKYEISKKLKIENININGNKTDIYIETKITEIRDNNGTKVYKITQEIKPDEAKYRRILEFIKVILNLSRNIKGRSEDLSPKLMIVGIYNNHPYRTYKDRIILKDEYSEESYDEIEEDEKDGKKILKIKHVISKSKKPLFEIIDADETHEKPQILSENKIATFIDNLFTEKDAAINKVRVFYDPSIEVQVNTIHNKDK